jgi:hypothetical protein
MKYLYIYLLLVLSASFYFSSSVQAKPELIIDYSPSSPYWHKNKYSVPINKQNAFEYRPKKGSCVEEQLNSRAADVSFGGKFSRILLLVRVSACNEGHSDWNRSNYLLVYEGKKRVAKIPVPYMSSIDALPQLDGEHDYLILSGAFFNTGGIDSWAELYQTSSGKLKKIKRFTNMFTGDCVGNGTGGDKGSKIFYDPVADSFSSQEFIEACPKKEE